MLERATQPSFSCLDRDQKDLPVLVSDILFSNKRPPFSQTKYRKPLTALSLSGKCLDEIPLLVPPVQTFTAKTCYATHILENHI